MGDMTLTEFLQEAFSQGWKIRTTEVFNSSIRMTIESMYGELTAQFNPNRFSGTTEITVYRDEKLIINEEIRNVDLMRNSVYVNIGAEEVVF